jgi:hypothetical protein
LNPDLFFPGGGETLSPNFLSLGNPNVFAAEKWCRTILRGMANQKQYFFAEKNRERKKKFGANPIFVTSLA